MHIAFDADDTLWHNEPIFVSTQERIAELLADWVPADVLGEKVSATEGRNLRFYGYGVKGFILSFVETALEVTDERVPPGIVREILNAGRAMVEHPVELLPGVEETLGKLASRYPLLLISKGDLFHQESKIARSGLGDHFSTIEIVSEKDIPTYGRVLARHAIPPGRFVMVGNSVKSDILPVVELGGNAIHIPYESIWELDRIEHRGAREEGFFVASSMVDVPEVLDHIARQSSEQGAARAGGTVKLP